MEAQNQALYQDFQRTVNDLNKQKDDLEKNIETVESQLKNMRHELTNLENAIILHTGGMSTVEVFTQQNLAIVPMPQGSEPLILNPYAAETLTQPPQPQVQQPPQPIHNNQANQPPITPEAQQTFAPPPNPLYDIGQNLTE